MYEGDDQSLASIVGESFGDGADFLGIDGAQDLPLGGDALINLAAVRPIDEGLKVAEQAINLTAVAASHFEDIPEAFGGDQATARALTLDDRICGYRRAVDEQVDLAQRNVERVDAMHQSVGLIGWR